MTWLRFYIALAFACGLVSHATPAHAAGWYGGVEQQQLEQRLPTPMRVYCTPTDNSWASPGEPAVYIGQWACDLLDNGKPGDSDPRTQRTWALAAHTLYHEWWHVAMHEDDEQNTDLGALVILRYALRTYWGLTPAQAQQVYDDLAGNGRAFTPYRPVFAPNAVDPLLLDGASS